jgi:importin-9
MKEAVLFGWDQLLTEFAEIGRQIDGNIATGLLEYVVAAIGSSGEGAILFFLCT